ncbi:SynChlorMet cassette protein ScmD [Methanocella sp. CWC-04]|uniref:SynChlorMet cassette protein ScmD n=1 Tax=Methanooceanicella nereidis TaxID=2052831 RepID=A0AAP2RC93_9EURY|nr:SynChlorMet cassette protein ScmD [Methanocella sp. CWC-04]
MRGVHLIDRPIANPSIVLREEFDDWALLYDPNTGETFGLNPTGVFIWKHLDGDHTVEDVFGELTENCEGVPDSYKNDVIEFILDLENRGLVGSKA